MGTSVEIIQEYYGKQARLACLHEVRRLAGAQTIPANSRCISFARGDGDRKQIANGVCRHAGLEMTASTHKHLGSQ